MTALRWRAIVDNDFAGDPDGLVSLAHVLLTDDVRVELITCTPVDPGLAHLAGVDASATASLGARTRVRSARGAGLAPITMSWPAPRTSPPAASRRPPRARSSRPAWPSPTCRSRSCAAARSPMWRRRSPSSRASASARPWCGSAAAAHDAPEYNRDTDAAAAASVLASGMPVVQVPLETYERLRVSVAEVRADLAHASYPGGWLAERLLDLPAFVTLHGVITLGDSALAAVVGARPELPPGCRTAACVTDIDMRLLWGDLLAKLRLHAPSHDPTTHGDDARSSDLRVEYLRAPIGIGTRAPGSRGSSITRRTRTSSRCPPATGSVVGERRRRERGDVAHRVRRRAARRRTPPTPWRVRSRVRRRVDASGRHPRSTPPCWMPRTGSPRGSSPRSRTPSSSAGASSTGSAGSGPTLRPRSDCARRSCCGSRSSCATGSCAPGCTRPHAACTRRS